MRFHTAVPALAAVCLSALSAEAAFIRPETTSVTTDGSSELSVRWLIEDVDVPLFGYSLVLERSVLTGDSTGGAIIDVAATNFFDERNLITAGGLTRDMDFSLIQGDGAGGAFVSTNADVLAGVTPTPGLNDVLVQVVFSIEVSQPGEYMFQLGTGSALSDTGGFPVGFDSEPLVITVVPVPATSMLLVVAGLAATRRTRAIH